MHVHLNFLFVDSRFWPRLSTACLSSRIPCWYKPEKSYTHSFHRNQSNFYSTWKWYEEICASHVRKTNCCDWSQYSNSIKNGPTIVHIFLCRSKNSTTKCSLKCLSSFCCKSFGKNKSSSSLHWLLLVLFCVLFVQWNIFPLSLL